MSKDMDHLLTPAQKRAKTLEKKKRAMLENLGVEPAKPKKVRKKRKPMTEEQRAAAAERLAKARAMRAPAKTPKAHPRVLELDDSHPLCYNNIKGELKFWKDKLSSIRNQKDSKDSKLRMEYQVTENYIKNLNIWLKDGVWCDHKFGKNMASTMSYVCYAMAYDKDGNIKRDYGTYYPDIGQVWTRELAKEYHGE